MPSLVFALRNLLRDLKSGELAVLMLALLVAVASLTAVGFFTSRIGRAVERQAGEVLAADLRVQSARPIAASYDDEARRRGMSGNPVLEVAISADGSLDQVIVRIPIRSKMRSRPTSKTLRPVAAWTIPITRPTARLAISTGAATSAVM